MTTVHSHSVVVARLRNWTKEGLLEFSGDKHPGTGKTRLYPEYAVIDALVLSALTAIGIPAVRAGGARPYAAVFHFSRQAYQDFLSGAAREITLVIFGAEGGSVYDGVGDNPHRCTLIYDPPNNQMDLGNPANRGNATILLNLTNLFRRLQQRMGEIDGQSEQARIAERPDPLAGKLRRRRRKASR
jgi:hypothetical protein